MSIISAGTTTNTALVQTGDTTGNLVLQTGSTPTTAMTINSSQIVNFANAPTIGGSPLPSGAVTLISTQTASSSLSVSWTGLTGYNKYLLIASGITFSGNDYLVLEFGTGATPTYLTSGYYNSMTAVDIGATSTVNSYRISNYINAMLSSPNQSLLKTNCECYIFGMTDSDNTSISFQSNGVTSVPAYGSYVGQSTLTNTTVKTAIRASGGSGNTFTGTLSLYGISS